VFCPHTATAVHRLDQLRVAGDTRAWTVVATAHPAKFDSVVEPLVEHPVDVPASLAAMLARPASAEPLAADNEALKNYLQR
jgi:threonine synthase